MVWATAAAMVLEMATASSGMLSDATNHAFRPPVIDAPGRRISCCLRNARCGGLRDRTRQAAALCDAVGVRIGSRPPFCRRHRFAGGQCPILPVSPGSGVAGCAGIATAASTGTVEWGTEQIRGRCRRACPGSGQGTGRVGPGRDGRGGPAGPGEDSGLPRVFLRGGILRGDADPCREGVAKGL